MKITLLLLLMEYFIVVFSMSAGDSFTKRRAYCDSAVRCCVVTLSFGMISETVLILRQHFAPMLLPRYYEVNMNLFLVTLNFLMAFMLIYIKLFAKEVKRIWITLFFPIAQTILVLLNLKFDVLYRVLDGGLLAVYPGIILLFINGILNFVFILGKLYYHRVRLGRNYIVVVLMYIATGFASCVVSYFTHTLLFAQTTFIYGFIVMIFIHFYVDNPLSNRLGLYNRRGFYRAIKEIIHYHPDVEYTIIQLDINNFQNFNEKYGYNTGNMLLRSISDYLQSKYRPIGEVGYFGEDDFILCLPRGVFGKKELTELSDSIDEISGEGYRLHFTAGEYQVTDRNMLPEMMCDRADYAHSKVHQDVLKDNYAVFAGKEEEEFEMRNYMVHSMQDAVEQNKFFIEIQPIYDACTQKPAYGEALVRWNDDRYGLISPAYFIPFAEQSGVITVLDRYVWNEVCKCQQTWKAEGLETTPISINISRVDIEQFDVPTYIAGLIEEYGLAPSDLKLEITESAFTSVDDVLIASVNRLHDIGCQILMDDFGVGYSNFNIFKRLPIDVLKADMGFIQDNSTTTKSRVVIESIVSMTKRLGMPIIVEGVETKEQYDSLKDLGCEYVQGFYFSRPISVEKFKALLAKQ